MKVVLPGVTLDYCNNVFRQQGVSIGDTQICAGGEEGKDSCKGITVLSEMLFKNSCDLNRACGTDPTVGQLRTDQMTLN